MSTFKWLAIMVLCSFGLARPLGAERLVAREAPNSSPLRRMVLPITEPEDEVSLAVTQLGQEIQLLDSFLPDVEDIDAGRVMMLKHAAEKVLECIAAYRIGHVKTIRAYNVLIVRIRGSHDLFDQIETPENRTRIRSLFALDETMTKERGFDDSPYTEITADIFTDIREQLLNLDHTVALSPDLAKSIREVKVDMNQLIARARAKKDRRSTLMAAIPVYHHLESLYPQFEDLRNVAAAYKIVLEIKGLGDWFADYDEIGLQQEDEADREFPENLSASSKR